MSETSWISGFSCPNFQCLSYSLQFPFSMPDALLLFHLSWIAYSRDGQTIIPRGIFLCVCDVFLTGLWRTPVMSLLWWWLFSTSPPVHSHAWVSQNHRSTTAIFCLFSFNGINILVLRCFGESQPWTVLQHGWSMRERMQSKFSTVWLIKDCTFIFLLWALLNIYSAGVYTFSVLLPLVINNLPWIYFADFCQSNSNISQGLK